MNNYLLCLLMVILWACGGGQDFDTAEQIERNPQANKVLQQDLLELFLKARSFDAASPLAQKFYQTQKKQPDPCYYMGVILREKGVYEEAERYFLEGLTYDAKHARTYDALGILYGVQNKRVRSLKAHQKAVELDQTNPKFWHNLGFALSINKQLDQAQAGDNAGILLRGVKKEDIHRGQVLAAKGSVTPHTEFEAEVYVLSKEEGGRHTPFFSGYKPQFYVRTTDVTGEVTLADGVEMVMPGDTATFKVKLVAPVALEEQQSFAIREGGKTVGAGVVTKIVA